MIDVKGPFKNEQVFKKASIKYLEGLGFTCFEMENEKEPGMPDLLCIDKENKALFIEFKIADEKGYVKFQKTQPHWYRLYAEKLQIIIVAWSSLHNNIVYIPPCCVDKLRMKI